MSKNQVNKTTADLRPYPMLALSQIKERLLSENVRVFDFGTGDPKIPLWEPIRKAVQDAIPSVSQYPSILGNKRLHEAHESYLLRRFTIKPCSQITCLPSRGSKEAIFHIALSLVGRCGGKKIIFYPNPGYPVYHASTLFAGGLPVPLTVNAENGYRLEPWKASKEQIENCAAIWVNYPHNPSGATVDNQYWEKMIEWCHRHDIVLLSDECYADIYDARFDKKDQNHTKIGIPNSPLAFSSDRVIAFHSLSKRSGMTGLRAGFIAGDSKILIPHMRARANFGLENPSHIQEGAIVAWDDDAHVALRRRIFTKRIDLLTPHLKTLGLIDRAPEAAFYFWCRIPKSYQGDDVRFCLELADKGVLSSPSSWLSEQQTGYFRLALVPDEEEIKSAIGILKNFIS